MNKISQAFQFQSQGMFSQALEIYEKLLENELSKNEYEVVFSNIGNIFFLKKDYNKAQDYYYKALGYNDNNEKIYFNIAMANLNKNLLPQAKEYFQKAIDINFNYLNAYINLGIVNKKLELYDEAIICFEKALDLNPNEPDTYYNYANVLMKKEQYNISLAFFQKALSLNSKSIHKIYYSMGLVHQYKLNYIKALEYFNKSLQLKTDYADAHFARATILLLMGDFKNGWNEYFYRWEATNELKKPDYQIKWYGGENLENKTILVQEEQGFGDNIQFIRYVSKLTKNKNTKVYLALREPLQRLFSNINNIEIISNNQYLQNIDYFVSLLDLPRIFYKDQNEFLFKDKYLEHLKEDIFDVKNKNKLNIGFAYRGNPKHKGDKKRNVSLSYFEKLFKLDFCDFYSLQYENDEDLESYLNTYKNIYLCKNIIKDFNDTANIVCKLDLVITIDSALVHLCGALGIKTFLILNKNSEFRWLLNRDDSIWYNSLRLFRQGEDFTLNKVFEKIIKDIKLLKDSK